MVTRSVGTWLSWIAIGALILLCASTLLQRPIIGLADNLDGGRVMEPAGIGFLESPGIFPDSRVPRLYSEKPANLLEHPASSPIMAWLAKQIGFGLETTPDTFDLRQLGVLYGLVATILVVVALRVGVPPLQLFLLVWVISDPAYLLYWNSFYPDAAMVLGTFGIVLWFLAWGDLTGFFELRPPRWILRVGLLLLLFLMVGMARAANLLTPYLIFLIIAFRAFAIPPPQVRGVGSVVALLSVFMLVASLPVIHYLGGTGRSFPITNAYHAMFKGIAEVSSYPEETLRTLNVPEEMWVLRGRPLGKISLRDHPVVDPRGKPMAAISEFSRLQLLGLYLSDPAAIVRGEKKLRGPLALNRPPVPNFELEPGRYFSRWGPMQAIRAALVTHASPIFWLGLAGLSGYLVVRIVQRRVLTRVQMAMAFLISCIATQIPIAVLGEGFFGLALHLNCARLCIDLLLAILTYQLFHAVVLRNFSGRRFHRGAETAVGE